jgi:hypothetical protein
MDRKASGWTDSIPQPTSVAIEKLRLFGPHALEIRVRDLQLLCELPAASGVMPYRCTPAGSSTSSAHSPSSAVR